MSDLPALPDDFNILEGLEDFDTADAGMPILVIDHDDCVFRDKQTGVVYDELDCILLGLVKTRILWPATVGENDPWLCRSLDAKIGRPQDGFPWEASKFTEADVTKDETGQVLAPCDRCVLKDWDSHPNRDAPWCSLQNTLPLLLNEGGAWVPTIIQIQRSGLKTCNTYLGSYHRRQQGTFTASTTITLKRQKKGSREYAVPQFVRGGETDQVDWPYYAQSYRDIRSYLQTPRNPSEDETAVAPPAASGPAPAPAPAPAPSAPAAAPAPAPAPPASPAPAAAPAAVPAAPVAAPAPPAPSAPPAAAPAPAPAPASAGNDEDEEELPF